MVRLVTFRTTERTVRCEQITTDGSSDHGEILRCQPSDVCRDSAGCLFELYHSTADVGVTLMEFERSSQQAEAEDGEKGSRYVLKYHYDKSFG